MKRNFFDRRRFLWSIACLAMAGPILQFPRKGSWPKIPGGDGDFLIVNGWVLTREDFASSEVVHNVV